MAEEQKSAVSHVVIRCSGGDLVPLEVQFARQSRVLNDMMHHLNVQENNIEIPCDNLKKSVVELLAEWMRFHEADGRPAEDASPSSSNNNTQQAKALTEEERTWFADLSEEQLFDVIQASNFLDMPHLLDKCCETVAAMIRGRTPEEIREILGITNDFTEEEYEQVLKENAWLGD